MKKRILIIENAIGFGGSLTSIVEALEKIKKEDNEITLLVTYLHHVRIKNVDVINKNKNIFWKMKHNTKSKVMKNICFYLNLIIEIITIIYYLKRKNIDILHLNNDIVCNLSGIIAAKMMNVPIICHQREDLSKSKIKIYLAKKVDKFIAVSEFIKSKIIALGVPEEKVTVIYEGVNLNKYQLLPIEKIRDLKSNLNIDKNTLIIGMIGVLLPWKGHIVLLQALEIVYNIYSNVYGIIVGGTPFENNLIEEDLKEYARRKNIIDRVSFLGHRDDVNVLINIMDIIVHASVMPEPFGRVIIEGMATRKPVVATKIGGPLEIIEDGKNGLLVNPNDPEDMAEKIIYLLKNTELRNEMGKKAFETAKYKFSIERHANLLEKVYRN